MLSDGDPLREQALLLVSELVTNVVLHVGSDLELVVSDGRDTLRVEVLDHSTELPERSLHPDEHGGFGLAIVEAVAHRWGIERREVGKAVWFELDR